MNELKEIVKKIGFTDKYLVIASIVVAVFIFACLAVFTFTDRDPIAYTLSAVGLLGTLIGFVVNKNREENKIKISKTNEEGTIIENDPE
jgi:hypothetical protein